MCYKRSANRRFILFKVQIPGGGEYVLMDEPQTVAFTALTWTPLLISMG